MTTVQIRFRYVSGYGYPEMAKFTNVKSTGFSDGFYVVSLEDGTVKAYSRNTIHEITELKNQEKI